MSQQQKVTKAQGNRANGNQSVKSIAAENQQNEQKTPAKLSVPDDTVASTNMNDIEVNERGEIVAGESVSVTNNAPASKKRRKRYREVLVDASEVMPRPSIWPLVMAFSIAVVLFGLIWNAIILFVGAAFLVASIIGWSLEKRDHTYKSAVPINRTTTKNTKVPAGSTSGVESSEQSHIE